MFFSCSEESFEKPEPVVPYSCPDCFKLSKLQNNHNYRSGFKLYDDLYLNHLKSVKLNKRDTNLSTYINFTEPGFYELQLKYTDSLQCDKDTVYQFVILNPERGETEWGLNTWTPKPFTENLLDLASMEIIFPKLIPENINTPYLVKLHEQEALKQVYGKCKLNEIDFNIKYGIGTVQAPPNTNKHSFTIANSAFNYTPNISSIQAIELADTIVKNTTLHSDTVYIIKHDVLIMEGITLLIQENSTLLIEEAVNIYNFGKIIINGTHNQPVYITCSTSSKFWGGIISKGDDANITAKHVFICSSGYHDSGEFRYGHANRQALFRIDNSSIELDHCYMIDHIGQIIYPTHSLVKFNNVVVQRAKSTGELSHSTGIIDNCYFSDFPDDSNNFKDDDNDALYLSNSDATISNSFFMYAKDDGLDTGSDKFGTISIENCHFEACFHEGLAMASYEGEAKHHSVESCTFTNCQQGLEMGFSSSKHTAVVNNCTFSENLIGIRFGDNYDWGPKNGNLTIKNSKSINNLEKDVWNMSRIIWAPKIDNMRFENTYVSKLSEQYPELKLIN